GEHVLTTRRRTDGRGDLKVRAVVADAPGRDDIRVRVRHLMPRAVCKAATASERSGRLTRGLRHLVPACAGRC
ncbi:MAG TPA: hypothetical protein VNC60_09810, partial [Actinomycetota bacterium]|nr:hypothetical protein [Actinomycetota bacterium]